MSARIGRRPLRWEVPAGLVGLLAAGLLRFWELGPPMLHHDESLHALYSWYLYTGRGYVHDPMMHGPILYELSALMYALFGPGDAVPRFGAALFGLMLVSFAWLTRDFVGRTAALVSAALMAVSTTLLHYSRFDRHDIYLAASALLALLAARAGLRWSARRWTIGALIFWAPSSRSTRPSSRTREASSLARSARLVTGSTRTGSRAVASPGTVVPGGLPRRAGRVGGQNPVPDARPCGG